MDEIRKHPVVYVKATFFSILLLAESYALTYAIAYFVDTQKFFKYDQQFTFFTIIFLYLIMLTNALLVGAWHTWEQYVVTPLPISLGIFIGLLPTNSTYAIVAAFFIFLLLSYETLLASNLKEQLIKFNPHLILRFISRGIILSFSIVPVVLILVANPDQKHVNIGKSIGNVAQSFVNKYVIPNVNTKIQNDLSSPKLEEADIDSTILLQNMNTLDVEKLMEENFSIKETVEKEVNRVVTPYKHLINPFLAILLFWMLHVYGFISKIIFNITISLVYSLAKKLSIFHTSTETVEREIIHF